jgi:hypothetical protein
VGLDDVIYIENSYLKAIGFQRIRVIDKKEGNLKLSQQQFQIIKNKSQPGL